MSEWGKSRLGKFTASEIGKLMVKGRSKDQYFGDGAMTYIESRAAEIFNQEPISDLDGMASIEWGNTHEPEAAALFAFKKEFDLTYYGKNNPKFYAYEPFKQWAGGSPDGELRKGAAVVEFKCPSTATHHIKYWRLKQGKDLKDEKPLYYGQIQFNMMCTGLHNGYFVSYDPRPQEEFVKMKVLEVPYDTAYCEELHERIGKAVDVLREIIFVDILGTETISV